MTLIDKDLFVFFYNLFDLLDANLFKVLQVAIIPLIYFFIVGFVIWDRKKESLLVLGIIILSKLIITGLGISFGDLFPLPYVNEHVQMKGTVLIGLSPFVSCSLGWSFGTVIWIFYKESRVVKWLTATFAILVCLLEVASGACYPVTALLGGILGVVTATSVYNLTAFIIKNNDSVLG